MLQDTVSSKTSRAQYERHAGRMPALPGGKTMKLSSLLKTLFRRRGFEKGMDQEMRFHLESYTDDLIKSGVSQTEAQRRARIEFGGVELTQEQCRQAKGVQRFDELRQDSSYAVRTLRKNPAFALVALITVALGIGADS